MEITSSDLWRPSGTVERDKYALVGILGFAIKHNLDRFVASHFFHRPWGLFNYWVPVGQVARVTQLPHEEVVFLETMLALALPFIWVGVVMTMKRLRSAKLPATLVALFFVPFLNLLFFIALCLIPERESATGVLTKKSSFAQKLPSSALGTAALSLLITVPIGLGMAVLGAQLLTRYGWGLFVALPFTMGFAAAVIYGIREPRNVGSCIGVAMLSVVLVGGALLALAFEGIVCLFMALPIGLPLAALGGACGYLVQKRRWAQSGAPAFLSLLLILVPGVQWIEHAVDASPPTFVVRTAIDVHAPPEVVWKKVVAFTEIPPPTEWLFRAGIAYPIRAEMIGSGRGAERHCVFSTGAFVEPIQIWDEPRRLKFSVTSNPPPMEEWPPYSHIQPPHLHGFLLSNGGQFLLTPLPNGGTRLEGTTWYQHGLWPAAYWKLWSDAIIHHIHLRVLRHIHDEAERETH